jgi:hypothetical protein
MGAMDIHISSDGDAHCFSSIFCVELHPNVAEPGRPASANAVYLCEFVLFHHGAQDWTLAAFMRPNEMGSPSACQILVAFQLFIRAVSCSLAPIQFI